METLWISTDRTRDKRPSEEELNSSSFISSYLFVYLRERGTTDRRREGPGNRESREQAPRTDGATEDARSDVAHVHAALLHNKCYGQGGAPAHPCGAVRSHNIALCKVRLRYLIAQGVRSSTRPTPRGRSPGTSCIPYGLPGTRRHETLPTLYSKLLASVAARGLGIPASSGPRPDSTHALVYADLNFLTFTDVIRYE